MVDFYPIALLILPGVYMDLIAPGLKKMTDRFMADNSIVPAAQEEYEPEASETTESDAMPNIDLDRVLSGAGEPAATDDGKHNAGSEASEENRNE